MHIFDTQRVAQGYTKDRPYFHPVVIDKVREYLNIARELKNGLDVGCGAGLSTIALKQICERVVGIDPSSEMIAAATPTTGVEYFPFPAENIPLDEKFDIITLSGAIDWIDRPKFFQEAKRLLTQDGLIVIYDNDFSGQMQGNPKFKQWHTDFLKKYPRPPRDNSPLDKEQLHENGFSLQRLENYQNEISYNLTEFINYLFTQSNVTTALRSANAKQLRDELTNSLKPFFKNKQQTLIYTGYIWHIK